MTIVEFFDVNNIEHLKSYKHLCDTGMWPVDFPPNEVVFPSVWHTMLAFKLAEAWVSYKLPQE